MMAPATHTSSFRTHWGKLPLSKRLTILVALLLTLGMVISGTVVISLLQRHLIEQIDSQLANAAEAIERDKSIAVFSQDPTSPTLFYIRVDSLGSGDIFTASYPGTVEISGKPIIPDLLPHTPELPADSITQPVTIRSHKSGMNWRAISLAVDANGDGITTSIVTIALPLNDIQQTMRATTLYFMLLGTIIMVAGGLLGSFMVKQSLSGLRNIESAAGKIAAGDLTQRITPEPPTTEVGSLARSLNTMLSQVEHAFEARQESENKIHRFVSDASHELRTPLAAIRGYGELYAMGGVPEDRIPEVMGRIHDEAARMGSLVEDLLTLARLDEGRPLEFADIDLVKMAENAAFDMRALDPSRVVTVMGLDEAKTPMTVVVPADRDRIQQVLTNLVGNVARYTPKGSPMELLVGYRSGFAVMEIRDHGPGIHSEDRQRVFERFYRSEDSRSRSLGGSGLGLAIVSGILQAHRGNAELSKTEGGGLTVTISLPLNSADSRRDTVNME